MVVQSVELLLDGALDEAVRAQWRALAEAGLRGVGGVGPGAGAGGHRPHITVGVAAEVYPRVEKQLPALLAAALPLRVRLGGLVLFGAGPLVLARLVTASTPLLALHTAVHRLLAQCPGSPGHMGDGVWTPHVTLARRLHADEAGRAVALLARRHDLVGQAVAARRWDGEGKREWLVAGDGQQR